MPHIHTPRTSKLGPYRSRALFLETLSIRAVIFTNPEIHFARTYGTIRNSKVPGRGFHLINFCAVVAIRKVTSIRFRFNYHMGKYSRM